MFLRYRGRQTETGNYGHFLPFSLPSKNQNNEKTLKKWKNLLEISSFYTSVSKTTIIWGTVPEIWSETDRIFVILGHFLPLYPPKNQKNQNFKTMKKVSWYIITLHKCIKHHNHMMYASWDMEYHRPNFLSFCHFYPTIDPKNKNMK